LKEKAGEKVLQAGGCNGRIAIMRKYIRLIELFLPAVLCCWALGAKRPNEVSTQRPGAKAAVIVCKGMIDDGLYKSIQRRTELALAGGANYLIYRIETYGGLLQAGDSIAKYFIFEAGAKAHTVAYVTSEAISAGAMIAVSCRDIIMKKNTTIGDCAPITTTGKLEGVEREKAESFVRAAFNRAAEANGYPKALLKAMVTMQVEVYRVKNLETGEYEYFESEYLPKDANGYDLGGRELIVKKGELLTLTASQAKEYGIARAVVEDVNGVLGYLAGRDGVQFAGKPEVLETNWSEEMVRRLNSPVVLSVLFMIGLLGVYMELNTPGLGLPGLVAVIAFTVMIGSKYLTGMANWVEVAVFIIGVLLLAVEIFVIPGFGVAGILGILCIFYGLFAMLVKNPPGRFPWPQTSFGWEYLSNSALGLLLGFAGFVVLAILFARYMPKVPLFNRLILAPTVLDESDKMKVSMTQPPEALAQLKIGAVGLVTSKLRPAGTARFGNAVVDVVSQGAFIDKDKQVEIMEIHGNRVVVRPAES